MLMDNNTDLKDLLKFCRTKIKIFVLFTIITCILGAVYTIFLQKPKYQSYATVILNGSENASTITTTDITINKSLIDTYTEVIKSRRVLDQVIQKLEMEDSYKELVGKIKVTDVNDAEIIKITVKYSSPENAQKIANAIAIFFTKEVTTLFNLSNVSILDEAVIDENPCNINYPLQALISMGAGLVISCIIVFVMYSFDTTIKSAEQIEQRIKLSTIGKVRELHNLEKGELIVETDPKCISSEDIRTIRTNLQLSLSSKATKAILITSPNPSEGKSFISSNLAIAFAQDGKKTILVDCDLRRGRQHETFNISNEFGLSSIISSPINNESKFLHKTSNKNLYVIPRGPVPINPSELLGNSTFKALLEYLKKNFDYIVLDGTPVQGLPDALILASLVDTSIIVCMNNQTTTEVLNSTKKALRSVKSEIAGVVINKIKENSSGYYGKYYGKYYE